MFEDVEHPVRTPHVEDHVDRTDHESEYRDRLCHARDGPPPFLTRNTQDGGDQCSRMTDADKENEVRDINAPEHRAVEPGHLQAVSPLVKN